GGDNLAHYSGPERRRHTSYYVWTHVTTSAGPVLPRRGRTGRRPGRSARASGPSSCVSGGGSLLDLALDLPLVGVGVVLTELVDADEGGRRVVGVVERTDAGLADVPDVVAGLERLHALLEGGHLGATVGAGHRTDVRRDGLAVRAAALDRRERGEDRRVVRLGG